MTIDTRSETRFGDIRAEILPFATHLAAERKSPRTIESYRETLTQLGDYLVAHGMPCAVSAIRREHVEGYLLDLTKRGRSSATVSLRFRALRPFFRYMIDEGELGTSPMARMKQPTVSTDPVPVLTRDQMKAMEKACAGTEFDDRRDLALLHMYLD